MTVISGLRQWSRAAALGAILLLGVAALDAQVPVSGFFDRSISVGATAHRYQVYVPLGHTRQRQWPVVLYLHACCPNGSDGLRQTSTGLAAAIRENREGFPVIAVFPQASPGHRWDNAMLAVAMASLDAATTEFNGDIHRTYVMGFSMGGRGVWSSLVQYPGRFAAAVVVAGPVAWIPDNWTPTEREVTQRDNPYLKSSDPFLALARSLDRIPLWLFHGARDTTAPLSDAREMWRALQGVKAPARFTEFDGGHDDRPVLTDPKTWTWLLDQRRQ